jgi:L-threonylcarbamoyladenylate synthase
MMAAEVLKDGGIVVVPTETRYGMAIRIDDSSCLERLYHIKKREKSLPTAIFVRSHEEIGHFGTLNNFSSRLAESFLPGPMTLVIPAKPGYAPPLTAENKIGIRYSSSKVIADLLENVQFNFTATSANISGTGELTQISEIAGIFEDEIDLYLDAGPLGSISSTVVDCTGRTAQVLRLGAISEEQIRLSLRES